MGLRHILVSTVNGVLEGGRRRSTQPRVFGIPVASVPGMSSPPRSAAAPERDTGCAGCGRPPRPDESPADDWGVGSDAAGELHVLCPECRRRDVGASV